MARKLDTPQYDWNRDFPTKFGWSSQETIHWLLVNRADLRKEIENLKKDLRKLKRDYKSATRGLQQHHDNWQAMKVAHERRMQDLAEYFGAKR